MSSKLHENGWPATAMTDEGKPFGYAGIGTAFETRGIKFIVVARTADDLETVMGLLDWDGECDPSRFSACAVTKAGTGSTS